MSLKAIRGTRDILPGEVERWQRVEAAARQVFALYGFRELRTPIFEDSAVFLKGTGETTDIVQKEMYRFQDLGGNDVTLRPEGTPPVIRAYLEHGLGQGHSIDRFYYIGPMFRYERPQKGRYRQFHQIGVEALGSGSPRVDAEIMQMAMRWLRELGVHQPRLTLNTVGDQETRAAYLGELVRAQARHLDALCQDCRRRHATNPLRVLDCKVAECQPILDQLPTIHDSLSSQSARHLERVQSLLDHWGVEYDLNARLVRGLDYYRETVFEITSEALGAQDSLLGGGRYDGLVAKMGGEDRPGTGFASGIERILLAMPDDVDGGAADVFVVSFDHESTEVAHDLVHGLRAAGVRTLSAAYDARNKKAQSRAARRSGAAWQLVVGPDEIAAGRYTLRRIADGERIQIAVSELPNKVVELLSGAKDAPG
ncbi:MAG TPA: histidine--tRNA ligase [Acidobacteriota bacterium]|nr:histidine--tRNA ligase [Acidobacteriota bacterium]